MKRLLIILPVLALLAASCNSQSRQQTSDFELQAKCSDMAAKAFTSGDYKKGDAYGNGSDYKNHFNSKYNKCFILISSYDVNSDFLTIDLYDALERNHYASYIGHNNCGVPLLGGDNSKKCQLDSGNIWYDGNDTKTPADYHVGFQGIAVGPGVGDENTQKQFMDHIQSFM